MGNRLKSLRDLLDNIKISTSVQLKSQREKRERMEQGEAFKKRMAGAQARWLSWLSVIPLTKSSPVQFQAKAHARDSGYLAGEEESTCRREWEWVQPPWKMAIYTKAESLLSLGPILLPRNPWSMSSMHQGEGWVARAALLLTTPNWTQPKVHPQWNG